MSELIMYTSESTRDQCKRYCNVRRRIDSEMGMGTGHDTVVLARAGLLTNLSHR